MSRESETNKAYKCEFCGVPTEWHRWVGSGYELYYCFDHYNEGEEAIQKKQKPKINETQLGA